MSSDDDRQTLITSLIGQLAAGLTAAVAVIYGAGALSIALRLYFTHLSWEAVLGQLPHDLILTTGFGQVILPAIIIGMLGAVLLNFLVNERHHGRLVRRIQKSMQSYLLARPSVPHFIRWLVVAVVLGAVETLISLPYYQYHAERYIHSGVVIPAERGLVVAGGLSAIFVGIALILLPRPVQGSVLSEFIPERPATSTVPTVDDAGADDEAAALVLEILGEDLPEPANEDSRAPANGDQADNRWKKPSALSRAEWIGWVGALVGFTVIPGIATFSAVTLFPPSLACSSDFNNGYLSGNLIGTSGSWAYMVEYRSTNFSHDYIAAVPLSSVKVETVGVYGDCATLAPTPAASPSATPGSSPKP
jgi:hypothetical protein